jgi:hypothetical protein
MRFLLIGFLSRFGWCAATKQITRQITVSAFKGIYAEQGKFWFATR